MDKDIGKLKGRLLVFGGAYSNLQALEHLKQLADSEGIAAQNVICTGDIVGYCAQPEECLALVMEWGIHCIAGNVEKQLSSQAEDCGCDFEDSSRCDLLSKQWYPYAQRAVSHESLEWMAMLPDHLRFEYAGKQCCVVHGSYTHVSQFIFKSTPWAKKQETFNACGAELVLAGHCGLPFEDSKNELTWLNAGVIGMPANDGSSEVWYLTLDDEKGLRRQFERMSYNHSLAKSLMEEKGLPDAYAQTLATGIWDNCDILPETETQEQGRRIVL